MPDDWEKMHGLDPNSPDNNGDFDDDGYTNLEEYINELAAWPAAQPISFHGATSNRYAQFSNWDFGWQPSQYDEVRIDSGAAVVDAAGQHAGTVVIATSSGDSAQLRIDSGWLRADEAVIIGGTPAANGELHLTGGALRAPILSKKDAGQFQFTGGTLHAGLIDFDLVNNGGTLATESSDRVTIVQANLQLSSGALQIDLSSPTGTDRFIVNGDVTLGGELRIRLLNGFVPDNDDLFIIVSADALSGRFSNINSQGRAYTADGTGSFLVTINPTLVALSQFAEILAGDFNDDGIVDAADYVVWRQNVDTTNLLPNDPRGGLIGTHQYELWRANFGLSSPASTVAIGVGVPEPVAWLLMALTRCCVAMGIFRDNRGA
jgi:hypothetical protein